MISSELPEVLGMSDRVLVMHEGRMTGIVDREGRDAGQDHGARVAIERARSKRGETTWPCNTLQTPALAKRPSAARRRLPPELSILGVMIGMMLLFEALGWIFVGQSFIANPLRLKIMILQEAVIGIIAVGVTQVIIMGGIDLSSGSVVGMTAMVAASLAQTAGLLPRDLSQPHRP